MKMSLINKRANLNKRASRSSSQVLTGFTKKRAHQSQARAETAAVSHPFLKDEFEKDLESKIIMNARDVHYVLVNNIAKKVFGWQLTRAKPDKETGSECLTHAKADWDVIWIDADFHIDRVKGMKPHQVINHFPGMTIISLKNNLAKYLKLIQKTLPGEYQFFPKTWIFPYESYDLMNFM